MCRSNSARVSPRNAKQPEGLPRSRARRQLSTTHNEGASTRCVESRKDAAGISATHHLGSAARLIALSHTADLGGRERTGIRFADLYAVVVDQTDGSRVAHLVNLERGADRLVFTVPAPDASTAIPALDGGLHVIDADGTPHTYNSSGNPTTVVDTGWEDADIITLTLPPGGSLSLRSQTAC